MSNCIVLARFDEEKDSQIGILRKALSDVGYSIPEWPFHITIAVYENIEKELLCNWTKEFASKHKKQKFIFNSLASFPPRGEQNEVVLFLPPSHSKTFVDFYYDFHQQYEEYCTGIGWHNSITHDNPIFHATIGATNMKEMQKAMEIIFTHNIFGCAEINALEVYTYPMKLLKSF